MIRELLTSVRLLVVVTLLVGVVYPLLVTGIAQVVWPNEANGSLIAGAGDTPAGSALVGQSFSQPYYFWGRLSAVNYDGDGSGGTNFGPLHNDLLANATARATALVAADPQATTKGPVPVDLLTASSSGLDPHITPAGALYQVARVATARHADADAIRKLVEEHTEGRTFGVFGEPRVNVLKLNLALDQRFPLQP
ncbi:MAG: potassium-transporting ATPase subunit KdpC [Planctomycetota bacterium]